jgi:hypothetical protein
MVMSHGVDAAPVGVDPDGMAEVNIHGAAPDVTFAVACAVDLNPDGLCTMASGWLPPGT